MATDQILQEPDACILFEPELNQLSTAAELGAYLKEWHGRINSPEQPLECLGAVLLAHNTALVDAVLRRIYSLAIERAANLAPTGDGENATPALAIVATGGYGRKELCPFSDVDVTFIPAREDDAYLNAIIKDMFQLVMDVVMYGANLKVGYAYRLLGDLGQLDHQTQTTLLDSRYLCGDLELFKEFRSAFRAQLLTADFMFQKLAERKAVIAKHGGEQIYGVEPNVKEGCGCLRSIQNAEWIAEVRFRVRFSRVWQTLVQNQIVSEKDAATIRKAREFLQRVRNALHIVSGEPRETLTAEKQEAIAALLQYPDSPEAPAVERFMRDFYTHVTHAKHIAKRTVNRCLDSEIPLALGLVSRNRALHVADSKMAEEDNALPLHAAEIAQAYGLAISDDIEEYVARFLETNPSPADPAHVGRIFTRLLRGSHISDTLRHLEDQGVLGWIVPEFAPLMTLIPYDAAHDYTVGAHSLLVVRNLENLKTETDTRLTDYKRISGEIALPEVLYMAGLIHDVGKQWPGHHEDTGAEAAARIAERFGWDAERRDKLVFLVRNHLLMAETSRFRDLSLDETLREFTRQVPDMDALNMLYLLTYADTKAVGEGVWTEVTGKFLSELYYRSEAVLTAGSPETGAPAYVPNLTRQRERIRKQLAQHNLPIDLIHEHTRNLPAQYLLNTPLEEMYLHIAMIGRLRDTYQPIIDFKHEYGSDFTEMTICTYDDPTPGLLAKITGVLYALDINVHVAQVFTRDASVRIAIDTLWTDYRGKPLNSAKKAEIQENLRSVLLNKLTLAELLAKRNKPVKEQTVYSVTIDDTASERFSVLEISAPDEKGVVYRLSKAISTLGWNIHAARLSVWGSRARDAFYITGPQGVKISASEAEKLLGVLPTAAFSNKRKVTSGV